MAVRTYYDIDTLGADARETVARVGWVVDEPDSRFRAGGDFLITDDFTLSRLWHTAMVAHTRPLRADPAAERFVATLIIEGHGKFTVNGQQLPFEPGVLLIHDDGAVVSLTTPVAAAAVRVSHHWHAILPAGIRHDDVPACIRPSARSMTLITTMVNTAFEQGLDAHDLGFVSWIASMDSAMAALLGSTLEQREVRTQTSTLFDRAALLIEERHADPAFTVGDIAAYFGISRPWLHQAFVRHGTTPYRMLQDARVSHALDLLPQLPTPAEIATAAADSGFDTARALRRALRARTAQDSGSN